MLYSQRTEHYLAASSVNVLLNTTCIKFEYMILNERSHTQYHSIYKCPKTKSSESINYCLLWVDGRENKE